MKLNDSPCLTCDNKGCGSYHDICPEYQRMLVEKRKRQEKLDIERRLNTQMIDHKTKLMRKIHHGKRR